jgi:tRNA threonylcarbamoyladenosine biosynthesis protein TsaE
MTWRFPCKTLADTELLASKVADLLSVPFWMALEGGLGAGKTTFTRALLKALGWTDVVRSPTYTLMEPYPLKGFTCYHLDLYRLSDPEELEYLGLRELQGDDCLVLVEWPDRGKGVLPTMDLGWHIQWEGDGRVFEAVPHTHVGECLLTRLGGRP